MIIDATCAKPFDGTPAGLTSTAECGLSESLLCPRNFLPLHCLMHMFCGQQGAASPGAKHGEVASGNPLLLSRKQSDSASSLGCASAAGPAPPPVERASIPEQPVQAAAAGAARTPGRASAEAGGAPGGPSGGLEEGEGRESERRMSHGMAGGSGASSSASQDRRGETGGSSSGGSVSGDSGDLATSASAKVGGVVIGITPESTLSQRPKMVRAWFPSRRLLLRFQSSSFCRALVRLCRHRSHSSMRHRVNKATAHSR